MTFLWLVLSALRSSRFLTRFRHRRIEGVPAGRRRRPKQLDTRSSAKRSIDRELAGDLNSATKR